MNKRNIILIVTLLTICFSCYTVRYNKVISYNDEFRGSSRKYLRIELDRDDRQSEIGDARLVLESSRNDKESSMVAYFIIPRLPSGFGPGGTGYLGAGYRKFELPLIDPVTEFKTKIDESFTMSTKVDTTGTVTAANIDTDTHEWIEERFMVRFTGEQQQSILPVEEVRFRFYFGPIPVTYILTGRNLALVKEVLQSNSKPKNNKPDTIHHI